MEVIDFPNYLIYPSGKVYSKCSKRYLTGRKVGRGYYMVNLYKDGKSKNYYIHRLVAKHYIPNPENKPQVDHIHRDKSDNHVDNLRWVNNSENNQNVGMRKTNTSGHKNISYNKRDDKYQYQKTIRGVIHTKYFKTLAEALCYKYIFILKIKSGVI